MKKLIGTLVLLNLVVTLIGQEPSQWRGVARDGIYNETELLKKWPDEGPELLWSSEEIGSGHASVSISGLRLYIAGREGNLEYLNCFTLDGKLIWKVPFGSKWQGSFPDSRSTPTIVDGKVYIVSGNAEVVCLDAISGQVLWSVDALEKYGASATLWGFCESPVVDDGKVFFTPGGEETHMIALHKDSGEELWTSESLQDSVAYVSPQIFTFEGRRILTSTSASFFYGIDAADGSLLWKYNYKEHTMQDHPYALVISVNTPLVHENKIFISKGYDHESLQFGLSGDGPSVERLWADTTLDVHVGGMVLVDGHIYGANWYHNRDGGWCCLDWNTGELKYETHWINKGSVIYADSLLYCYEEKRGTMALVEPTPEEFRIISSFETALGSGPAWAHPVIHDGVLYVRRGKALMAYDISAE